MILERINDLVYFNNSGIRHYTHISRLDFVDLGNNKIKVLIRPFNSDLVYWEGQSSEITDINGNSYGNTILDVISGLGSSNVSINTNGAIGDAFGRLRISEPYSIFDSKELDGSASRIWTDVTGGTGSISKSDPNSAVSLSVAADGDFAIRQTFQRFNYQAGKSQFVLLTGSLPTANNVNSRIGLIEGEVGAEASPYNIYNGIFFSSINGAVYVNIMKNGSNTAVIQSSWNIDKMNGSGPSGVTLDFTKVQIFVIDFEWLGVGRVRFGFNIDGVTHYCHQIVHANLITSTYTKTPNLPVRYEIRSTGGADSMQKICVSIMSEGGVDQSGITHIGSSALNTLADNTAGTNNTVMAVIRLQSDRPYSTLRLLSFSGLLFSDTPVRWSIALVAGNFQISINGTPTAIDDLAGSVDLTGATINFWEAAAAGTDTVLEADISPYTIEEGFLAGSKNAPAAAIAPADNLLTVGQCSTGCRSAFVIYAQAYGANTMRYALKFKEVI